MRVMRVVRSMPVTCIPLRLRQRGKPFRNRGKRLDRFHAIKRFDEKTIGLVERTPFNGHAMRRVVIHKRTGARPVAGIEHHHARRGRRGIAAQVDGRELRDVVAVHAEAEGLDVGRTLGNGLCVDAVGCAQPALAMRPQFAQIVLPRQRRRKKHQRLHLTAALRRKCGKRGAEAQSAQRHPFDARAAAQIADRRRDAREPCIDPATLFFAAGRIAGSRVVEAQHRHARRGEPFRQPAPAPVGAQRVVAERIAEHHAVASFPRMKPTRTAVEDDRSHGDSSCDRDPGAKRASKARDRIGIAATRFGICKPVCQVFVGI
jgi:hypothetical protein